MNQFDIRVDDERRRLQSFTDEALVQRLFAIAEQQTTFTLAERKACMYETGVRFRKMTDAGAVGR